MIRQFLLFIFYFLFFGGAFSSALLSSALLASLFVILEEAFYKCMNEMEFSLQCHRLVCKEGAERGSGLREERRGERESERTHFPIPAVVFFSIQFNSIQLLPGNGRYLR